MAPPGIFPDTPSRDARNPVLWPRRSNEPDSCSGCIRGGKHGLGAILRQGELNLHYHTIMAYLLTYLESQLDSQLSAETEVYWDMNHTLPLTVNNSSLYSVLNSHTGSLVVAAKHLVIY